MHFMLKHCSPNRKSRTAGTPCNTLSAFSFSPHILIHLKLFIFPLVLRVMETGRRANCRGSQWNYPCRTRQRISSQADRASVLIAPRWNCFPIKLTRVKETKCELIPSFSSPTQARGRKMAISPNTLSPLFLSFPFFNKRLGEIIGFLASVANSKHDYEKQFPGGTETKDRLSKICNVH